MDLLNKDSGETMIETLVGIILLGIIVTVSFSILIRIYSNPNTIHKHEAFLLASQEITNCINNKTVTDTIYTNTNENLTVSRKILKHEDFYTVSVKVVPTNSELEIVSLSAGYVTNITSMK